MPRGAEDRIMNGLLKANPQLGIEEAESLLNCDWQIVAPAHRAYEEDLWPAIWALAAVLVRQFSGKIFIQAGLAEFAAMPVHLGPRCLLATEIQSQALLIGLGCKPENAVCFGDARGHNFSVGKLLPGEISSTPLTGFAVAGYLGFAALAKRVGIPSYRLEYTVQEAQLPWIEGATSQWPSEPITFIGLGHLGNAYLAALFFLSRREKFVPTLHLVDRDRFEEPNYKTQILLDDSQVWIGLEKVAYLSDMASSFGWAVTAESAEVDWGWRGKTPNAGIAILGLDKFEPRRATFSAGFTWIVDAGLNSRFEAPRISWNSVPADQKLANTLFAEEQPQQSGDINTGLRRQLESTPGQCGWLRFLQVEASAPAMGLVAAALALSELRLVVAGRPQQVTASLGLWSPILPFFVEEARLANSTSEVQIVSECQ